MMVMMTMVVYLFRVKVMRVEMVAGGKSGVGVGGDVFEVDGRLRVAVVLVVVVAAATSPATHNDCSFRWLA